METLGNGIMPVYNMADNNTRGGMGFGDDWIWVILFFALIGGGNFGFGGAANVVTSDYLLNQTSRLSEQILTQANQTNQGICDATYAINNGIKDLGAQLSQCCCDNRLAIANQTNDLQAQAAANHSAATLLASQNHAADQLQNA